MWSRDIKMNRTSENTNWLKVRKFLNDLHLWGGLISGIVVFIVCITGTIYVYNTEIREAVIPEYYTVKPAGDRLPIDSLLAVVSPGIQGTITGVNIPFSKTATVGVLFNKAVQGEIAGGRSGGVEKSDQAAAGLKTDEGKIVRSQKPKEAPKRGGRRRSNQMMVNPYTGDLIGDASEVKTKTAKFMQKMFSLHRWLMLNEIPTPIFEGVENRKLGSWITGTATLLFLLGVMTGIVIWFPKKLRGWKNGLRIKWSGNWKRVNHDIHNTLGLYTWIILFLMAITGPFWSFDWYREGWQKTWGTHPSQQMVQNDKERLVSKILPGKQTLSLKETVSAVNQVLPYDGDITINFASDSSGTIRVSKNRVGFFAPAAGDKLTLDQYSGEVLETDVFRDKPLRTRIGGSLKALHLGNIYGQFSKLLYFIGCLVATSLPVTGVLIWVNKMKKKPKRKKK